MTQESNSPGDGHGTPSERLGTDGEWKRLMETWGPCSFGPTMQPAEDDSMSREEVREYLNRALLQAIRDITSRPEAEEDDEGA